MLIALKLNNSNSKRFGNCHLIVRNRSMNPSITNMKHFAIIVNGFWPFVIVGKNSILNVAGFLDPPLHCHKFACSPAKALGWFKPKRIVIHVCLWGKYLNKLENHMLWIPILLNFNHSLLNLNHSQVIHSLSWEGKSRVTFLRQSFSL